MTRRPKPTPAELSLLDPDGSFRTQLEADRIALDSIRAGGDPRALTPMAHRLAGAAGTFGYEQLGELAMELDDRYRDGRPPTRADVDRLFAMLDVALRTNSKSV